MKLQKVIVAGLAAAGVIVFATIARPSGYATATTLQFEAMANALAAQGVVLAPLPVGQTLKSAVPASLTAGGAADLAVATYGKVAQPVVFEGRLTMVDQDPPIQALPTYAIQLTGLNLPPFGGKGTVDNQHQELVVFVDAVSGKVLLAITVR